MCIRDSPASVPASQNCPGVSPSVLRRCWTVPASVPAYFSRWRRERHLAWPLPKVKLRLVTSYVTSYDQWNKFQTLTDNMKGGRSVAQTIFSDSLWGSLSTYIANLYNDQTTKDLSTQTFSTTTPPLFQGRCSSLLRVFDLGMGGTQNFVHGIYREKIPRYRVYRGTCFVVVVTKP